MVVSRELHQLKRDIEELRGKMCLLWEERQTTDEDLLQVAKELDSLINCYHRRFACDKRNPYDGAFSY